MSRVYSTMPTFALHANCHCRFQSLRPATPCLLFVGCYGPVIRLSASLGWPVNVW
jgi:hypothetical protein